MVVSEWILYPAVAAEYSTQSAENTIVAKAASDNMPMLTYVSMYFERRVPRFTNTTYFCFIDIKFGLTELQKT